MGYNISNNDFKPYYSKLSRDSLNALFGPGTLVYEKEMKSLKERSKYNKGEIIENECEYS